MPDRGRAVSERKANIGRLLAIWALLLLAAHDASGGDDPRFRNQIAPILERRCIHCHGGSTRKETSR